MPSKKKKSPKRIRGEWSQDQLSAALADIKNGTSVRQASNIYGIPRKTLERRFKSGDTIKSRMGPACSLGVKNEERMVHHIKTMQKHGFSFTRDDLRTLAYNFAYELKINHKFNNDIKKAGYDWLYSFLIRHPDVSVCKKESLFLTGRLSMNRQKVNEYFTFLSEIFKQYGLVNKPGSIYNMDKTSLQLNNRSGRIITEKGSKSIFTVVTCCNAEGVFLPPACIMKGKNKKLEFEDDMPPGSVVFMSEKSACINTQIFFDWLKMHFLPRKPVGTVALILDGDSYCHSIEMFEFAQSEGILLIFLPSDTIYYLQPLGHAVYKSLKRNFFDAVSKWLKNNPGRKLTRLQFGELFSETWNKSATPTNAISGFKATGVYPFNPGAIPNYAFADSNMSINPTLARPISSLLQVPLKSKCNEIDINTTNSKVIQNIQSIDLKFDTVEQNVQSVIVSPTELLNETCPVPSITKGSILKHKNVQTALLTFSQNIQKLKLKNVTKKTIRSRKETQKKLVRIKPVLTRNCSKRMKIS